MKNVLKLLITAIATLLIITGCGTTPKEETSATASAEATQATTQPVEILFWHSMSGRNQEKLTKIVDDFNASQTKYKVVAENQGKYDESTSKFFNMNGGTGSPAIIQIGEQNLQSMIDSGLVASITELNKEYKYDESQLLPQVMNFYTVDNTLYAMPFNASSPVLYYNVEALKKAGIEKAPETFEDIIEYGPKITKANEKMRAFSKPVYGYALDQMVTNMGGYTVNNENGRKERATEVAYQEQILTIFTFLSDLIKQDQFVNYGTSFDNVKAGFNNGDIAMYITTSAQAAGIIDEAPFEVGIAPLPLPKGVERQGVYAGGGALCVSKNIDKTIAEGVMEFLKYGTSAEVQAVWAGETGYFPINKNSYETQTMKDIYAKKPQLKVAADQLLNSKVNGVTAGPLLSLLPQLRNDLQVAEETVFNGGDPKKAMDEAVVNTNKAIETANKSVKK